MTRRFLGGVSVGLISVAIGRDRQPICAVLRPSRGACATRRPRGVVAAEHPATRLTAFYEARMRAGADISVLLHDDARRKELSRRAWSGEEL
jgi:hypothetical protein